MGKTLDNDNNPRKHSLSLRCPIVNVNHPKGKAASSEKLKSLLKDMGLDSYDIPSCEDDQMQYFSGVGFIDNQLIALTDEESEALNKELSGLFNKYTGMKFTYQDIFFEAVNNVKSNASLQSCVNAFYSHKKELVDFINSKYFDETFWSDIKNGDLDVVINYYAVKATYSELGLKNFDLIEKHVNVPGIKGVYNEFVSVIKEQIEQISKSNLPDNVYFKTMNVFDNLQYKLSNFV